MSEELLLQKMKEASDLASKAISRSKSLIMLSKEELFIRKSIKAFSDVMYTKYQTEDQRPRLHEKDRVFLPEEIY